MTRRQRILAGAGLAAVFAIVLVVALVLRGGDDDGEGGGDLERGIVLTPGQGNSYATGVVTGDDGRIVVPVSTWDGRTRGTTVIRLGGDGGPRVTTPSPKAASVAAAQRARGGPAVAVRAADGGGPTVFRLRPDGTRVRPTPIEVPGGRGAQITALTTDPKGNLVAAGAVPVDGGAGGRPFVARFEGVAVKDVQVAPEAPPSARWKFVAAHDDGGVTVAGDARVDGRAVITTARFNRDGTITPGSAARIDDPSDAYSGGLAPARDGGVYVASNSNGRTQLLHVLESGALDPQFHTPATPGRGVGLALEDDGSVILVTSVWSKSRQAVGLRRFTGLDKGTRG